MSEDRWYASLEPVLGKVVRELDESAAQIGEQILGGSMTSLEQYQAQVQMRRTYLGMIADIRKTLADDNANSDDEAGRSPS